MYLLLSCCPAEGRISGIVDAPNACATLAIPLAIFDQVSRGHRRTPQLAPQQGAVPAVNLAIASSFTL